MSADTPANDVPSNPQSKPPEIALGDFFVSVPPGSLRAISQDSIRWLPKQKKEVEEEEPDDPGRELLLPELELYCPSERCDGLRWFKAFNNRLKLIGFGRDEAFIRYRCRNCGQTSKVYAVFFNQKLDTEPLLAYKFGEYPAFGPELPARLQKLLKSDAELFRKGWNAERLGFGIAAVTYYRRVIENHKQQIFDKIIEVAKDENFDPQKIEELEKARDDNSFSRSLEAVKDAIPPSLKIMGGHNPLSMLHSSLSDGVHNLSDEECLKMAQEARATLVALADRIALAVQERRDFEQTVLRLRRK